MLSPNSPRARIVCLEGPSAAGKTSLATVLAREVGAAVVPELEAAGAPPPAEAAAWFLARHAAQWRQAQALATTTVPLVVLDGDPFKGLWYNWVYPPAGGPKLEALVALHRTAVARGALAFPDLYVILLATDAQLRARRAADAERTRRNFETHLALIAPQRRYFAALQVCDPPRVRFAETDDRAVLSAVVCDALAGLPPGAPDTPAILAQVARYLITHAPSGARVDAPAG
jgi:hypothetical protein